MEGALEAHEARGEVGDLDGVAAAVLQNRLHDGGVAHVAGARLRFSVAVHDHVAEALLLVAREQARENGIAVEAGKAPPHDARVGVDERRDATVADRGELEGIHGRKFFGVAHSRSLKRGLRRPWPTEGRTDHCTN